MEDQDTLRKTLQIQATEINLLRKLLFNAFDETGNFCGLNRHERAKIAEIVKELGQDGKNADK